MMTQRGRSRKQPAPHRALDADANYNASLGAAAKPKQQAKKRRSNACPSSPPSTPPSSPPRSPNTPMMDSTPPPHALGQHDSLTDADLMTNALMTTFSGSHKGVGAAGIALEAPAPIPEGGGDMAAATATMLTAMQQAAAINAAAAAAATVAASAAAAKKRKKPSGTGAAAVAAAGSSRQGAGKKGKGGPSLPLKPGLCSFCGETQSPMWRKGPEQYPRLCNRCGMRYSRNRNDLPKAFSAKVAARIQAERQRGGSSQASDIGDMQGLDSGAFDGGFDSLPSSPYSDGAAPAAGMSASLVQHALLLGPPAAAASGRTHSDSADTGSLATAGTLTGTDSGLMSDDFEAAVAAVAAMAAAAPVAAAAASGDSRSKSSRARRSTEKAAALQGRQVRRSQGGQARMATGNEARSGGSALLDLVALLSAEHASSIKEEPTDEEGHTGPYAARYSDDISADEAEETELVDGNGSGSRASKRRRGPSRLAMATYADAMGSPMSAAAAADRGAMSWEALVAAASIDLEAEEAAAAARAAAAAAAAAAVGTGMSQQQLSARRAQLAFQRAIDEGYASTQHAASQQQGRQAAWPPADAFGPPAFAAAAPAQPAQGPRHEPLSLDLLAQLLHQIAGQPQHHHPGRFAAATSSPARLPEHYGPVNYAPAAAMQQQQPALQFLMHQTALQVVLQQLAGAGALSQGQLPNSVTTLQGPSAPPSAGPINNPASAAAGAAPQLPPVMPLVRAAGMLDHPAMQQLMQQQVQNLLGMTAAYGASATGQNARTGPT